MCTGKTKKLIYIKNRQHYISQITETLSVYFLINEMLLKYTIMYLFHVGGVS